MTHRIRRRAHTSTKDVEKRLRETFIEGFGFGLSYLKPTDVHKLHKAVKNVSIDVKFWNDLIKLSMAAKSVTEFKDELLKVRMKKGRGKK